MSGVGFAMGMERLMILAEAEGISLGQRDGIDVYVMGLGNVGTTPLEIATACRANGYVSEFNITPRGLKAQFKSVDRKGAKIAVIVGESELEQHLCNVKHIASQTQVSCDIDDVVDTIEVLLRGEEE